MRDSAPFLGLQLRCSVLAVLLALTVARAAENLNLHAVEEGHIPPWLVGVALVLTGLIVCLVGKSIFKPTLACSGFLGGVSLAFLVLHKVQMETTEPIQNFALIELISCLVTGLVGAVLFVFIWKLALVGLGVLVGLILAVGLMHVHALQHLLEVVPRPAFIAAVVVITAVVIFLLENYVIVLVCAVVGSFAVVCGLDEFMGTGLDQQVLRVLTDPHETHFAFTNKMIPLGIIFVCFIFLGMASQTHLIRKYKADEPEVRYVLVEDRV